MTPQPTSSPEAFRKMSSEDQLFLVESLGTLQASTALHRQLASATETDILEVMLMQGPEDDQSAMLLSFALFQRKPSRSGEAPTTCIIPMQLAGVNPLKDLLLQKVNSTRSFRLGHLVIEDHSPTLLYLTARKPLIQSHPGLATLASWVHWFSLGIVTQWGADP